MGQYTGGGRFVTKGWRFADFGVKFIKSFYFYDIIYFTSNIYINNSMCVWSWISFKEFQPLVFKMWACVLRVGVLPYVTLFLSVTGLFV